MTNSLKARLGQRLGQLLLCWSLVPSASAQATIEGSREVLRVSGFGTLAATDVQQPQGWKFLRDATQSGDNSRFGTGTDSRLGLQLNYAPTHSLEFVGQVIGAHTSSYADDTDAIRWAYAAWRPNADYTVRVGRLNQSTYLMADYREVGFAYLPVRPPVDFYGALPPVADGADLERVWRLDSGNLRLRAQVYGAKTATGGVSEPYPLKPLVSLIVAHQGTDGLLLRSSFTRGKAKSSPSAVPLINALRGLSALPVPSVAAEANQLADRLDLDDRPVTFFHLGAAREWGAWQWSTEYARVTGANFSSLYGLVGRRFGAFTLYAQASRVTSPEPFTAEPTWGAQLAPVLGPDLAAQVQQLGSAGALAANRFPWRQSTVSLGGRWDLHDRAALKLQYDRMRMPENSNWLWGGSTYGPSRASVATVSLDFVF